MPKILARLIPAVGVAAVVYSLYLLIKYTVKGLSSKERTRVVFVAIIAIVSMIILFGVNFTSG